MNTFEMLNLILRKAYHAGLEPEISFEYDKEDKDINVLIDIKPNFFEDFAFFYQEKEGKLCYSTFFKTNVDDDYAAKLFNDDRGIFDWYIISDEGDEIHLLNEIDFADLTEECISNIIKYLLEEHELTNYLTSISN